MVKSTPAGGYCAGSLRDSLPIRGNTTTGPPTEVEVRFIEEEPSRMSRVELEHQAGERLGPVADSLRDMYNNGWPTVITSFESFAGAA